MTSDYIYIKLCSNKSISLSNLKIKLKDKSKIWSKNINIRLWMNGEICRHPGEGKPSFTVYLC